MNASTIARRWLLVGMGLLGSATPALSATESIANGSTVDHPQSVTGVWESRISSSRILGLSIHVDTTARAKLTLLRNLDQRIDRVDITTYLREGDRTQRYWWGPSAPGHVDWHDNRLRLRTRSHFPTGVAEMKLDIVLDPKTSRWSGFVSVPGFAGKAALTRPAGSLAGAPIGTWAWQSPARARITCTHIALANDGHVIVWEDILNALGRRDPSGTGASFSSWYGVVLDDPKATAIGPQWQLRLGNLIDGDTFVGQLSDDGAVFSGTYLHDGVGPSSLDNSRRPFRWTRGREDTCIADSAQ